MSCRARGDTGNGVGIYESKRSRSTLIPIYTSDTVVDDPKDRLVDIFIQ